jgi:iron(III) transport system permease protein
LPRLGVRFPSPLILVAFVLAGLITLPLLYVIFSAITADGAIWRRLWTTRIPELLFNTFSLAVSVAGIDLVLGVSLAWILTRYRFTGSTIWDWLLILPLAIPSYVLAYTYTYLLQHNGPLEQAWKIIAGADAQVFSPFSFAGATLVMSINTFPFVYLLARSAFMNLNVSFEEAARATGASQLSTFFRVSLPMIRPSLFAGLFLAILYVASDFGAMAMLRYQTFTYAIYQQMTGRFDNTAAACLSLFLVSCTFIFLLGERWFRQRSRFYQTTSRFRKPTPHSCSSIQAVGFTGFLTIVFAIAFGIPLFLLIQWTMDALAAGKMSSGFMGYLWNSLSLAGGTATLAIIFGIPLAYLACRKQTWTSLLCVQGAYTGYVLPGPVAALAVLVLISQLIPELYGTIVVLLIAYLVHFLPVALQGMESTLQQLSPNLEEAAKSLGARSFRTFFSVTLPLVRGGFISAWILVFVQCLKELPATLLLRPVGFDTLAIRIWLEASEELYQLAAPPALLIVALTTPVVLLLMKKGSKTV